MLGDIHLNDTRLKIWRQPGADKKPVLVFLNDSLGCIRLWRDFPQKLGEAPDVAY